MKSPHAVRLLLLVLSVGIFSCSSSKYASTGTSEYDDMYFNKGDRYPVMTNGTTTVVKQVESDGGVGVGYNSKTLNPDYGHPQDAVVENDYAEDEYYVEDHDDQYMDKAIDDYLRNNSTARRYSSPRYYSDFDDIFWSDPMYYSGTIFDPMYRSYYGVYSPFAYSSYYRPYSSFYRPWGPRINVSLAFGFGYGSGWGNPYYDPFYYGGGFGYGYGYYNPYNRYYGSAWCPPSYYGGYNNVVVINNIENANTGNVRYGTRQPRGNSYIVDNGIRSRSAATSTSQRTIRSRADNSVRSTTQRTINNDRVVNQSNMRTRNADSYNNVNRSGTRFRTHSLDSRSGSGINQRNSNSTNSSLQQRNSINGNVYTRPNSNSSNTRRSLDRRSNNYSSTPSRSSGAREVKPNRSSSRDAINNRSNYSRSSTPSRNYSSSPSRSKSSYTSPSRSRSSAAPSRSNYSSSPSRSRSYSAPSRSSSPSPGRSSSAPSRSSGARSITR